VRDTSTTSQPSSAKISAQARPIPLEAPVINALRPLNPSSITFSPAPSHRSLHIFIVTQATAGVQGPGFRLSAGMTMQTASV
jgi:hypothetical protein